MIHLRRVVGSSMLPTLKDGQLVIVSTFRSPQVGDVVVAILNKREVIKRITAISKDWHVQLLGDNSSASTDSRHHGSIPKRHILGVVIWPRHLSK